MAPARPVYLGEFEYLVLLAILRLGPEAYAPSILRALAEHAGRTVSRGALYRTLDRLDNKALLRWRVHVGTAERNDMPRRAYTLTATGLASLRASHRAMSRMAIGVEGLLGDASS